MSKRTSIPIEVTCKICGEQYRPDRADFVAGTWGTCPGCRERTRWGDRTLESSQSESEEADRCPS